MTYNLIIKEEAANEIEVAFIYYEDQVAGLGLRFTQALDIHFMHIQKNPENYSFFLGQQKFRSHSIEHFPFSIIYEVDQDNIIVFAVHNHHQLQTNF